MCAGAVAFLPLDYVIPFILANKALKLPTWKKTCHYVVAGLYAFIGEAHRQPATSADLNLCS